MAEVTRGAWAKRLCNELGEPLSDHRKFAIVSWETAEGTRARWNPLATTRIMPGSTDYNTTHVKNYPDLNTGLKATVATLKESGHGYAAIVAAILSNRAAHEILLAVAQSDWGTGTLSLAVLPYVKDDFDLYANRPIGQ